jgi:hypothetical protein
VGFQVEPVYENATYQGLSQVRQLLAALEKSDRAIERIRSCAREMSISLTEAERDKFALIYCGHG